eukprot:Pgem_evm1s13339
MLYKKVSNTFAGDSGFYLYTDGGGSTGEYLTVRVSNSSLEGGWTATASVDASIVSTYFTGYSNIPNNNTNDVGNLISVGSFLSTNQVAFSTDYQFSCAVSDDKKSMVICNCQSVNCRMAENTALTSSERQINIFPQDFDEIQFVSDSWWAYNQFTTNRYVRDKIMLHFALGYPSSQYLGYFFNELIEVFGSTGTELDFFTFTWYSNLWMSTNMGTSTSSFFQQLSALGTLGFKLENDIYDQPPKITMSSSEAMSEFQSTLTAMASTNQYLNSLQEETMTIEILGNISSAMQSNQETYASYTNQQVAVQQTNVNSINTSITHSMDLLNGTIAQYKSDITTTMKAIKKAATTAEIMEVVSIAMGLINGLCCSAMGILRGRSEMLSEKESDTYTGWMVGSKFLNGMSQLGKYFTDGLDGLKDEIYDIMAFTGIPSTPNTGSCADDVQSTMTQIMAGSFLLENLANLPADQIVSTGVLGNVTTMLMDSSVDLPAQLESCLQSPLKQLQEACDSLHVDCSAVTADVDTVISVGESVATQTNTLISAVYQLISLKIQAAMYTESANEWNSVINSIKADEATMALAVSQQYQSLATEGVLLSNSLLATCLSFSYQYSLKYSEVDQSSAQSCAKIPKFVSSDSLSGLESYLEIQTTADNLRNEYLSSFTASRWKGQETSFFDIPNLNEGGSNGVYSTEPIGFDLQSFQNVNSSYERDIYTANLYLPADAHWLNQYLELYDPLLSAKLAALRIVFRGLKTTCDVIYGTITSQQSQSYLSLQTNTAITVDTYSVVQSYQYAPQNGSYFSETPTYCELEAGTNCDGDLNLPMYAILPVVHGTYTITLSAFDFCEVDVNSITGIALDWQGFVQTTS